MMVNDSAHMRTIIREHFVRNNNYEKITLKTRTFKEMNNDDFNDDNEVKFSEFSRNLC